MAWKMATIILIPKPFKDHKLPTNYRPITPLLFPSKLLERTVLDALQFFLLDKIKQYVFYQGHSTTLQLTHLTALALTYKQQRTDIFCLP